MADIRIPQNPGISQSADFTAAEILLLQHLSGLGDPNDDRILFWDDSVGNYAFLTVGSSLAITGTTIEVAGAAEQSAGLLKFTYFV